MAVIIRIKANINSVAIWRDRHATWTIRKHGYCEDYLWTKEEGTRCQKRHSANEGWETRLLIEIPVRGLVGWAVLGQGPILNKIEHV